MQHTSNPDIVHDLQQQSLLLPLSIFWTTSCFILGFICNRSNFFLTTRPKVGRTWSLEGNNPRISSQSLDSIHLSGWWRISFMCLRPGHSLIFTVLCDHKERIMSLEPTNNKPIRIKHLKLLFHINSFFHCITTDGERRFWPWVYFISLKNSGNTVYDGQGTSYLKVQ